MPRKRKHKLSPKELALRCLEAERKHLLKVQGGPWNLSGLLRKNQKDLKRVREQLKNL